MNQFIKVVITSFFTVVAINSLTACSEGGSSSSGRVDEKPTTPTDYNTQSCVFERTDGERAIIQNLSRPSIITASFGKKYDRALLEGVHEASVLESIQFINQTGGTVYQAPRTPTTKCSRDLFSVAKNLPSDLSNEWNRAAGGDGILLGLFLPRKSFPSTQDKAAIIVTLNGNRWTLVHEFMHHLFLKQAEVDGYTDEAAKAEFGEVIRLIDQIDNSGSSDDEKARRYADILPRFYAAFDSMLVHFTLEEATIERTMKVDSNRGKLRFAPASTDWYLNSSIEKAVGLYGQIKSLANEIARRDTRPQTTTMVRQVISDIDNRINEAQNVKNNYNAEFKAPIALMEGSMDEHIGCSHEKESEQMMEVMESVLERF